MTSYNNTLGSNFQLPSLINNNSLTKILAIDNNNNVNYKNLTSINPFNQTLNTTNNVTFDSLAITSLTGPVSSTGNTISLFTNMALYQTTITTTTNTVTTAISFSSTPNSNYIITAKASAFCKIGTAIGGGGIFRQTKGITNVSGALTLSNNLENLINVTTSPVSLSGTTINISNSGSNIIVTVTGLNSQTIKDVTATGGCCFFQIRRVTNDNHVISALLILTSAQNTTIPDANIIVTSNGKKLIIQVVGANNTIIDWIADIEILSTK